MPSVGQIDRIASKDAPAGTRATETGLWNRALSIANLPAVAREPVAVMPKRAPGFPLARAIEAFLEANGAWPSKERFELFARRLGILVEDAHGKRWQEWIDEVNADRLKRGLSSPDPQTRYRGSDAEIKLPAGGIPEAPQRSENRCSSHWSRFDCLDALREFDALAAETPELRPTQKAYKAISRERGWPSSSTIAVHGGFRELLEEARSLERSSSGSEPKPTYSRVDG